MYVLEKYGDFGVFWGAELHKHIRCLAMDEDLTTVRLIPSFDTRYNLELDFQRHPFEVNPHPVAEVMPVLLKGGQSASREEAVEEMKDCRSILHHWCWSKVIPENRKSLFRDQFRPRSHHILPIYPWTTWNPILLFSKPLLTAMLHTILERESLGLETEICTPWEREDLELPLFLYFILYYSFI